MISRSNNRKREIVVVEEEEEIEREKEVVTGVVKERVRITVEIVKE